MVGIVVFALLTSLPLCPGRERSWEQSRGPREEEEEKPHTLFFTPLFSPRKTKPRVAKERKKREREEKKKKRVTTTVGSSSFGR